jgi:hypothetical protein
MKRYRVTTQVTKTLNWEGGVASVEVKAPLGARCVNLISCQEPEKVLDRLRRGEGGVSTFCLVFKKMNPPDT